MGSHPSLSADPAREPATASPPAKPRIAVVVVAYVTKHVGRSSAADRAVEPLAGGDKVSAFRLDVGAYLRSFEEPAPGAGR